MFGPTRDTNGRTGTQKLLSGIGVALAVLVVASMLAAPASALSSGEAQARAQSTDLADGEDVVLEGSESDLGLAAHDTEDILPADLADGEDVLESGDDNWQTTWDGDYPMTALDGDCSGELDGVETCDVTKPVIIISM